MPLTTRGAPYPGDGPGVPNDVPGDLRKLAEWSDAHPGCTPMSAATRAALTGTALWEGRLVYETDTNRLLVRIDSSWRRVSVGDTLGGEWQPATLAFTGVTGTPTVTSARYQRIGNTVTLQATISAVTVTSSGALTIAVPGAAPALPGPTLVGTAILDSFDFYPVIVFGGQMTVTTAPGAHSGLINVSYEAS